jgi:tetratricopeptide (TPR) repeat protein
MRRFVVLLVVLMFLPAPVAAQSTSAQLAEIGWKALRSNDGDKAASAFGEALSLNPRDPSLQVGAGAAAHMLGRDADALRFLQRAVELEPRLLPASLLLGEIAYSQGNIDLAIRSYERALAQAPGNPQLTARLADWKKEATLHHGFEERRDDRFTVMFEGPGEEQLAVRATTVLDGAFRRIGRTLGEYPTNPITVILYTQKQFRDLTSAPDWSDGLFDGNRIRLPVRGASQDLPQFDRVLTHELTHAVVHSIAARGVPVWLHEGLAMYFEPRDVAEAEARLLESHGFVPLVDLESSFNQLNLQEATLAYDESLVAVRTLIQRIGTGLGLLIQDLGEGQPIEQAIERFGFTYASFNRDLARRLHAGTP